MTDYTPTTWVDGSTALSVDNLNHLETGIQTAHAELAAHLAASPLDHADELATDTKLGNRTADPTSAPSTDGPGTLTQWLSWITNRVKTLVGGSNWYDNPGISINAFRNSHVLAASDPHTVTNAQLGAWTPSNDGAGSGLDADKLGGVTQGNVGRISSGSYSGNGAASQSIALGWTPKMVVVHRSTGTLWLTCDTTDAIIASITTGDITSASASTNVIIESGGFKVFGSGSGGANVSGGSYLYTAFGTVL